MRWAPAVLAILLALLIAAPVRARTLGVSPSRIELEVPANGEASVEFRFHDFAGVVQIGVENIPLRISPSLATVSPESQTVLLTFYGDGSNTTRTYEGKILFLTVGSEDGINIGVKVRARVTDVADEGFWSQRGLIIVPAVALAFILGAGVIAARKRGHFRVTGRRG